MSRIVSCGIDFGTSNSTCSVSGVHGVRMVPLEGDQFTIPSAIFFSPTGQASFGREAIQKYLDGEDGRLMRGLKTILGTALMQEETYIGGRNKSFQDILALFIQHIKNKAEEFSGETIKNVVMGRPVHFHDARPDADLKSQEILEQIAKRVGFENVEFQYEPIAAAFSHEHHIEGEKISLVIDLGGGTSDFTVIRLSSDRNNVKDRSGDILATTGVKVGGVNFDQRLSLKFFMPCLGLGSGFRDMFDKSKIHIAPLSPYIDLSEWAKIHHAYTKRAMGNVQDILRRSLEPEKIERLIKIQKNKLGHALLQIVEATKISLTDQNTVESDLASVGIEFKNTVTRENFEDSIQDHVKKIFLSIDDCLDKSGMDPSQIELVILTGGSTELPVINRAVAEMFPNAQIAQTNKFGSVGDGLGRYAGLVF